MNLSMRTFRGANCVPDGDDEGFVPEGGGSQGFGTKPVNVPEGTVATVGFEVSTDGGSGCVDLEVFVVSGKRQFEDGYERGSEGEAHLTLSPRHARRLAKALLLAADESDAEMAALEEG